MSDGSVQFSNQISWLAQTPSQGGCVEKIPHDIWNKTNQKERPDRRPRGVSASSEDMNSPISIGSGDVHPTRFQIFLSAV